MAPFLIIVINPSVSVALEKQIHKELLHFRGQGKIKNNLLFIYNLCIIHHLLPKRIWDSFTITIIFKPSAEKQKNMFSENP